MIAARGSEEDPGEGPLSQVTTMIKALIPGSASIAVDYPAAIYDDGTYPVSVYEGIADTISKVKAYVAACGSSSRIVLLGYSQGGNVMTDALAGGVLKPDPLTEDYRKYSMFRRSPILFERRVAHNVFLLLVKGVVVFGDPSYTTGQSFDVGTATKSGIFSRGGSSLAKLNTYAGVLRSYCSVHDTICATGDSLTVHSAEVSTYALAATQFVVSLNL
jgi:hypothetical protein